MSGGPFLTIYTDIPSPYQVEFFDACSREGLDLVVVYMRRRDPSRWWHDAPLAHAHEFLCDSGRWARIREATATAQLVVLSGYGNRRVRSQLGTRVREGRPWVLWGERPGSFLKGELGRWIRRVRLRFVERGAREIWGVGQWGCDGWRRQFGGRVPVRSLAYHSNLDRFRVERNRGEAGAGVRLLYLGQLIQRKGVDLLCEELAWLLGQNRDTRVTIAGRGRLAGACARALHSVRERVEIKDAVQWGDVPSLYSQADVVCMPSRYDGWGMVVPEAMASGAVVVTTTAVGAAVELIDDGVTGFLCAPACRESLRTALVRAASLVRSGGACEMGARAGRAAMAYSTSAGVKRLRILAQSAAMG